MKKYKLVIFDWDGTLCDSCAHIVTAMQAAAQACNLPVVEGAAIRETIGLALELSIQQLYPQLSAAQIVQMAERYRFHFFTGHPGYVLFDGVVDLLSQLKQADYLLAVATAKGQQGLNHALAETGLSDYFDAVRTADQTASKPHPQMLHELMDVLHVAPSATVMIGDSVYDLEMAKNANVDGVACVYGEVDLPGLQACQPIRCLENIRELWDFLNEDNASTK